MRALNGITCIILGCAAIYGVSSLLEERERLKEGRALARTRVVSLNTQLKQHKLTSSETITRMEGEAREKSRRFFTSAGRLLHLDENMTTTRRRSSLFLNVILVVWGLKEGMDDFRTSIETLELYRPHFAHMVYISPSVSCAHRAFWNVPCFDCGDAHVRFGHKCTVDVARSLTPILEDDVAGILHIHADFWLTPAFINLGNSLIQEHPNAFWLPEASPHHPSLRNTIFLCSDLPDMPIPTTGWWWDNEACAPPCVDPPQHGATVAAKAAFAAKHAADDVTWKWNPDLGTWTDLYFLPRKAWEVYDSVEQVLTANKVMNDVAIPAAMLTSCDRTSGKVIVLGHCLGSCCTNVDDLAKIPNFACGHKIRLQDPNEIRQLQDAWASAGQERGVFKK
mmetsp:Transcript_37806/g.84466  ORF Transcript_37806/g.84466 Transcript_37806/m.84466 type:complete len:394 (-) Transcript_37806:236-1417(-)